MSEHTPAVLDGPDPDVVRIGSAADLAASVPALLGFAPEHSLVLLLLKDRQLALTARFDLPVDSATLDQVAVMAVRARATEAIACLYCPPDQASAHCAMLPALEQSLREADAALVDVLLVDDGRYWPLHQTGPCGPGDPIPATSALEADQVARGQASVAPSRDQLLAAYAWDPDPALDGELLARAAEAMPASLVERADVTWESCLALANGRSGDPSLDAGIALTGMQDVRIRDYLLLQATTSGIDEHAILAALTSLALRSPEHLLPRAAGTAAFLSYLQGRSLPAEALAGLGGSDNLARLVTTAIKAALPPHELRDGLAGIEADVIGGLAPQHPTTITTEGNN